MKHYGNGATGGCFALKFRVIIYTFYNDVAVITDKLKNQC